MERHGRSERGVTACAPVDRRLDALHEDVGGQAARLAQPLGGRCAVQVVAAALALGLQHKALGVRLRVRKDLLCGGIFQVIEAPQPCSSGVQVASGGYLEPVKVLTSAADAGSVQLQRVASNTNDLLGSLASDENRTSFLPVPVNCGHIFSKAPAPIQELFIFG